MAIYNEILVGRFNRALQKLFGIKGSPPVRQVAGEITPSHAIFTGVENRFLESWDRYATIDVVTAGGAGLLGQVRMSNPLGSNVMVVLERLLIFARLNNVTFDIFGGTINTDLAVVPTFQSGIRLDARGRQGSGAGATAVLSTTNNAAIQSGANGAQRLRWGILASTTQEVLGVEEFQGWPILPGDYVQVVDEIGNVDFTVSWVWRERYLEESERQ